MERQLEVDNQAVLGTGDLLLYALLSAFLLSSVAAFLWAWARADGWAAEPLGFLAAGLLLGVLISHHTLRWLLLLMMRRPSPPGGPRCARRRRRVAAVTTFVPRAETVELLEETLRALAGMSFPHDTWLLDEADHEGARELCRRLGVHHFSRKSLPRYQQPAGPFEARAKHGNLNAWLAEVGFERYDVVATFDPDHIPIPGFLDEVVGYLDDPAVGYVQDPQAYYNQEASFIARGVAESTYGYYSCSEMASYGLGFPHGEGCHTTHRVAALEEIGGFQPHIGEDLLTSLAYRAAGWRGVYVPKILARGLAPVDWRGYVDQQIRWARGELDIRFRHYPRLARRLGRGTRVLGFLYSLHYVQDSLFALFALAALVSVLWTGVVPAAFELLGELEFAVLVLVLAACSIFRQRFYLGGSAERGLHWRSWILWLARWPFVLRALVEVVARRGRGFTRPGATLSRKGPGVRKRVLGPHLWVATIVAAGLAAGLARGTVVPTSVAAAGLAIAVSVGLALSEGLDFPPPFQRQLARKWRATAR